jgi:hypothetical protein
MVTSSAIARFLSGQPHGEVSAPSTAFQPTRELCELAWPSLGIDGTVGSPRRIGTGFQPRSRPVARTSSIVPGKALHPRVLRSVNQVAHRRGALRRLIEVPMLDVLPS